MAVIKRKTSTGKTRYSVKIYRKGGTQEWVGTYGTQREAREAEREAMSRTHSPTNETCQQFAARWVRDYPRARASTNQHNKQQVKAFAAADEFKNVRLDDVTKRMARSWILEHPSHLGAVRAMFTDAVNDDLCKQNPFRNLGLKKSQGRKKLVVLAEDELRALIEHARAHHGEYGDEYAALIEFAAYTCMRPGELITLRWSDIDFEQGEIHVRRTLSGNKWIELPKNGRQRTIVLPPPARAALRSVPRRLDDERVFSSITGKQFSKGTWHYAWNPVRAAFGRPKMDFYELRHYGCTYMLDELGLGPADAAVQLGHTDGGRLVMDLYGHPSEERARERIRQAFGERVVQLRSVDG